MVDSYRRGIIFDVSWQTFRNLFFKSGNLVIEGWEIFVRKYCHVLSGKCLEKYGFQKTM